MAIIRSLAVGKARKSAGNLTFRVVRGRTIASEKIGPRPITRADGALTEAEFMFSLISIFASMHATDINLSFNKTKYGSARNSFMKLNYAGLKAAFLPLFAQNPDATVHTDAAIEEAVTTYATANPTVIYRVKKAGADPIYLTGAWSSDQNPTEKFSGTVTALSIGGKSITEGGDGVALTNGTAVDVIISGSDLSGLTTVQVKVGNNTYPMSITTMSATSIVGKLTPTADSDGYSVAYAVVINGSTAFSATSKEEDIYG